MSYPFIPGAGDEKGARSSPGLPDGQDYLDMILLQAKAHHRCLRKFRNLGVTCCLYRKCHPDTRSPHAVFSMEPEHGPLSMSSCPHDPQDPSWQVIT